MVVCFLFFVFFLGGGGGGGVAMFFHLVGPHFQEILMSTFVWTPPHL